jgi:hypothetical protein
MRAVFVVGIPVHVNASQTTTTTPDVETQKLIEIESLKFGDVLQVNRSFANIFLRRTPKQGDQIGRIFAHCATAFFGQSFEKLQMQRKFLCYFFSMLYNNFVKNARL